MRGATFSPSLTPFQLSVSTHAPHAGSDRLAVPACPNPPSFNPRSPCGERQGKRGANRINQGSFNPRSPCGERPSTLLQPLADTLFQPTLPMRGATENHYLPWAKSAVSTHAPHAGSDLCANHNISASCCFNPRSPCGERPSYIMLSL